MWPPTVISFKALAATLKMGGYASAAIYFSASRSAAERRGYALDELMIRSVRDYTRSCFRGLSGPTRARSLPLDQLHLLPGSRSAWVPAGPINPRACIIVGSWWLCREVELSNFRAKLVEHSGSGSTHRASLHLPASKTDQLALGIARTLCCLCCSSPSTLRAQRPVHALIDQLLFLRTASWKIC